MDNWSLLKVQVDSSILVKGVGVEVVRGLLAGVALQLVDGRPIHIIPMVVERPDGVHQVAHQIHMQTVEPQPGQPVQLLPIHMRTVLKRHLGMQTLAHQIHMPVAMVAVRLDGIQLVGHQTPMLAAMVARLPVGKPDQEHLIPRGPVVDGDQLQTTDGELLLTVHKPMIADGEERRTTRTADGEETPTTRTVDGGETLMTETMSLAGRPRRLLLLVHLRHTQLLQPPMHQPLRHMHQRQHRPSQRQHQRHMHQKRRPLLPHRLQQPILLLHQGLE